MDYARSGGPLTLPSPPVGERDQNEESCVVGVFSSLSPAAGERVRVRGLYHERIRFMNDPGQEAPSPALGAFTKTPMLP